MNLEYWQIGRSIRNFSKKNTVQLRHFCLDIMLLFFNILSRFSIPQCPPISRSWFYTIKDVSGVLESSLIVVVQIETGLLLQ